MYGGTEILAGNLSLELANQGHDVHLVYAGKKLDEKFSRHANQHLHMLKLIEIPYFRALDFQYKCMKLCIDLIDTYCVDVMIVFGAGSFPGYLFNKIKRINTSWPLLVFYAMDSMKMEYLRSKISEQNIFQAFKKWLWYKSLIRSDISSCKNSDLILASSKDTLNHLILDYNISPLKIRLLYEGIPDLFGNNIPVLDPEVPTFLHIGGGTRKGTEYFLKSLKLLNDNFNIKCKAVIIRATKENINQANNLGITVEAYMHVSVAELKHHYASCTAFISPSLSEGFCLPIIEAAMFSKPLVVTDVGSLPELVTNGENGFIVPVGDVDMLADKLYQLAVNKKLRNKLGKKARERAEKFTISIMASNLLFAINTLVHA